MSEFWGKDDQAPAVTPVPEGIAHLDFKPELIGTASVFIRALFEAKAIRLQEQVDSLWGYKRGLTFKASIAGGPSIQIIEKRSSNGDDVELVFNRLQPKVPDGEPFIGGTRVIETYSWGTTGSLTKVQKRLPNHDGRFSEYSYNVPPDEVAIMIGELDRIYQTITGHTEATSNEPRREAE